MKAEKVMKMMELELKKVEIKDVKQLSVGRHTLYQGDCCEGLKMIKDNSVHLVVTSPPYNIGIGDGKWADKLPLKEYQELTETWLGECYRILADGGKICVNLPFNDNQSVALMHLKIMKELGFMLISNIMWIKWDPKREEKFAVSKWKLERFRFPIIQRLINAYEVILVMQKNQGCSAYKADLTSYEFERWKYNVWFFRPLTDRTHPAPFPPELPKRLIKLYSSPNQVVLDPFLGSGTTMKVADELNRVCIGCELDESYVKMALERMERKAFLMCKTQYLGFSQSSISPLTTLNKGCGRG